VKRNVPLLKINGSAAVKSTIGGRQASAFACLGSMPYVDAFRQEQNVFGNVCRVIGAALEVADH
jgi:hypothetical protein